MIEFVKPAGGGNSTMNVWSPLTRSNSAIVNGTTYTSTSNCGTYSPSSPWQTGVALPTDGVIYVQSVPSLTTDPNYWPATFTGSTGTDGVTSSANNNLTAASGPFAAADVGQAIFIGGTGAGGSDQCRTITAYNSKTSVTYSGAAIATGTRTYDISPVALSCADSTVINDTTPRSRPQRLPRPVHTNVVLELGGNAH